MDELDGVPCSVLGYHIKTRTQICLSCCVTAVLELLVYIVVLAADSACIVQHLRDAQPLIAGLTGLWMVLPAAVCFAAVIASPWQWPSDARDDAVDGSIGPGMAESSCGSQHVWFVVRQLANLVFFPVGAIYR